jgi:hypothetical protein
MPASSIPQTWYAYLITLPHLGIPGSRYNKICGYVRFRSASQPGETTKTGARRSAQRHGERLLSGTAQWPPNDRLGFGLWLKVKCLHREEFGVVGWTDPEGRRLYLRVLLLAYYDPDGRLVYAGRAGTGISTAELERLWRRLQPLATDTMPLDVPPPRTSRFGSPLVLSRVHWVRPELVAEVKS